MLDDAPWNPFVGELIERLPLDEASRREVAARFALACSEQALAACDRADVYYPEVFGAGARRLAQWLADPSEARRQALQDASNEVRGWKDPFGSEHVGTMVRSVVDGGGLASATYGAARTAVDAAVTIAGAARACGEEPAPVRPQQVTLLRATITDALRAGWTPRDDAPAAWQGVDELVRRTWPRWLVELGRFGDASELKACAAIVDASTLRRAVAVADTRWPALDADHARGRELLRATSDRIETYTYRVAGVEYEDGNYTLVDYAGDRTRAQTEPAYAAAAAALATGGPLDDAVASLIDATRLAACVHATIAAVVADRAVAIAAAAHDQLTAGAVNVVLRKQW